MLKFIHFFVNWLAILNGDIHFDIALLCCISMLDYPFVRVK